ncbi:MAG: hypothetical protein HY075_06470, partial [Deltaproteobacteria bacterium]|nr:hypothetical protein [Deltaproteobacteria bacterium]
MSSRAIKRHGAFLEATLAVLCLLCLLPGLLSQFSIGLGNTLAATPYVWLDEAGPTEATRTAYEDGYAGYRCRVGNGNFCYGGGQALLDAAIASALPRDWVTARATVQAPG